jgi:hypothetical protein
MHSVTRAKTPKPPAGQTAGYLKGMVKHSFGIRYGLGISRWKVNGHLAVWISSRPPYSLFVEQQPCLGHPNRHNGDGRCGNGCVFDRLLDFCKAQCGLLSFDISVDEEQITGIEIQGDSNPFRETLRSLPQ